MAEPGHAELAVPPIAALLSDAAASARVPEYFVVKKITTGGTFRVRHRLLYLPNAMVDQHGGFEENTA